MNLFSKMAGALIVIAALLFIPALASAADEDVIDKALRQINSEYIRVLRMQLKDAKRKCDRDTKYCDLYLLRLVTSRINAK